MAAGRGRSFSSWAMARLALLSISTSTLVVTRAVAAAPVDVIAPFAGSGVRGVSGDGGPATAARLNGAQGLGVAVDPASGDVYISDTANCRVRKVSGGIITTIAGNGVCAYGGDGGPATSASLNFPLGLAVDGAGSLFIADVFSNRIRKVSAGTITTAVGNGSAAVLFDPLDLAFDPRNGDLLIADLSHVKKLSGGILSTVASGLSGPQGITVAANGDIYVAEYLGNVVSRISAGVRTVVAGNGVNGYTGDGGPATSAAVGEPRDVLLDASGDLLISQNGVCAIRRVHSGTITTAYGNLCLVPPAIGFPATPGNAIGRPDLLAMDASNRLYICAWSDSRVIRIQPDSPPTASFTFAASATPLQIGFDGAASTDPDGGTLIYAWDFGDGGSSSVAAPGHTYVAAGTYNVTLTVTDPAGSSAGVTHPVTVSSSCTPPLTPTANNTGPYCAGATISLSTASITGATYAWAGPNGFTSSLQNPTIPNATTANAGTYSVTETAGGCTSAPGTTTVIVNLVPAMPNITAPLEVGAGTANWTASVDMHPGSTYAWSITNGNGTITAGQGTFQITFTAGRDTAIPLTLRVVERSPDGCDSPEALFAVTVVPGGNGMSFHTVTPCRLLDTRNPAGPLGGPSLDAGEARHFIPAPACGILPTARALAANVTVLAPEQDGYLQFWGFGGTQPATSTVNFALGKTRANNAIIVMPAGASSGFWVWNGSFGTTPMLIDVSGYFE